MRSEVSEWLATCVGSPICILLLSWCLLIYQNQPSATKRRIDIFTIAILAQSLLHQLGLLLFAVFTLVQPTRHFEEFCSVLVWLLNSSGILQETSLTSIAVFAALTVRDEGPNVKKHHIKYHLASLAVMSACVGVTGVLTSETGSCVFLAHDISPKYGLYFNGLRSLLVLTTLLSLLTALFRGTCRSSPKAELLKSVSDLSEASSKNSSSSVGAFECQHHHHGHWEPSSDSCASGSTNSRACLKKRRLEADEASGWPTIYTILFVCYVFDHLPLLIISIRPDLLRNICSVQNLATWLPLVKDTLLPIFLAIFDKMFCQYIAKVYTKQDRSTRIAHCGVDGKFRHFEQDNEYKLQLNLNHGLKFPLSEAVSGAAGNGSLYAGLHNHPSRVGRNGTMLLGSQTHLHYGNNSRSNASSGDNTYASIANTPESSSTYVGSSYENRRRHHHQLLESITNKSPKQQHMAHQQARNLGRANSTSNGKCNGAYASSSSVAERQQHQQQGFASRRNDVDVFGQNTKLVESLMQFDEQCGYGARRLKHFAKSLDEIREEAPRRNSRSVLGNREAERMYPGHLRPYLHQQQQAERARSHMAALRRNQSFDLHLRYPRIELPQVNSSRTYDVKRELAVKRGLQMIEQTRGNERDYEEEDEAGYETSDDESCDRESQDFDTMSSCRSRARSCCSVTTVANDDFEYFQRKGTKYQSQLPRPLESKGSMRCFTPRIIENNNNNKTNNDGIKVINSKPVIQSYRLKKKMSAGYSLNDLDKFNVANDHKCSAGGTNGSSKQPPALSIESLKSILRSSDVSYLDNGEICRHDIGGSAPDFKKIFVTEFI
ncbi:uncharacterized protein LOC106643469 [Copidosoma floridanum]|uniref:uncharacterized protein LOC106643469 n=1 Tax=Copidosoma floridanum TaxID=29053 RepID=UPI0006C97165|nr:uncharacterized protein LOC106643469 [Copidosoma floridanum]